jgi:tetratricopeptide (TPR) repeat protein
VYLQGKSQEANPAGFRAGSDPERAPGSVRGPGRPLNRTRRPWWIPLLFLFLLFAVGCAKYNTFYNAKKSFDNAENVREQAIKQHQDPPKPTGAQKNDYDTAIRKAQKILDEYPGHSLTDDALFLQAKSYYRLESYRMSIRKFDLLFTNFPQTPYLEEALYLTAMDYLLIGAVDRSQEYLDRLAKLYPESKFQAETRKVSGDNSFALEQWPEAADSYRAYLDLDADIAERDRIGLRLAECYWEMREYQEAAAVLQEVSENTTSADLGFQARLLRARVHVKMGDFELVETLVTALRSQAAVYNAQGDVLLVEAESLIEQGRGDEASPLLENMPAEWETPVVKAQAADLLGYLYLGREEWEQAREQFQTALLRKSELEDENRTRRLNDNLQDYLAAEAALPDAQPQRVATLKLLQANAMLFGFEKPNAAASLYVQAAADTAADSTAAARALYGAYVTYDLYLDKPDSGAIFADELVARYPESPQAFEVRSGGSGDLLDFLLARQATRQSENYAALSEEEKKALTEESVFLPTAGAGQDGLPGIRRRQIYLSRRANILFEPPERAVLAAQQRQEEAFAEAAQQKAARATADSLQALDGAGGTIVPGAGMTPQGTDPPANPDETASGAAESQGAGDATGDEEDGEGKGGEKDEKDDDEDKDKKKKKQEDNWDFLR